MKKTYIVKELNYNGTKFIAEIEKEPEKGSSDLLYSLWLFEKGTGRKQYVIGKYADGRSERQMVKDLVDYLYIDWERGNCFDFYLEDNEIIEDAFWRHYDNNIKRA